MSFAEIRADANSTVAQCLGEACTHIDSAATETACTVVITSAADALDLTVGGIVSEQRWSGLVDQTELSARPESGDQIVTAAGVTYLVDDAHDQQGMWRMSLQQQAT
jgi:hypothetical protein